MRIVFAGTPDFAAAHLDYLIDQLSRRKASNNADDEGFNGQASPEIVAVYTQPDRKAGRGKKLLPSPVKTLALANNLPIYQPLSFKNDDDLNQLRALRADIMIVAAYGMLLPKTVLDLPRFGCINIHASLLPRWRGAAPIERSIIAGDSETGITIMQMAEGLDTGDMLLKDNCPIDDQDTGDSVREKLITLGKPLLIKALKGVEEQSLKPEVQDDQLSCYAHKLKKDEGEIDWSEPASHIARKIRAFTSALASFTHLSKERIRVNGAIVLPSAIFNTKETQALLDSAKAGQVVKISEAGLWVSCGGENSTSASGKSILCITEVQLPGKRSMNIKDILNGRPNLFMQGQCFVGPDPTE